MAQNKLWRRSFWDEHGLRFPEGVLHEDIPVVVPAHFQARSVDVVSRPVYLYRMREDGELSITQRRAELRTLRDRIAAVEQARRHIVRHGPYGSRRWYDQCVVAEDLRYHLDVLDEAGDEYRALFLEQRPRTWTAPAPASRTTCRRSSGGSGSSSAAGASRSCWSCWRAAAGRRSTGPGWPGTARPRRSRCCSARPAARPPEAISLA